MEQVKNVVIVFMITFLLIYSITNKRFSFWINSGEIVIFNKKINIKKFIFKLLFVYFCIFIILNFALKISKNLEFYFTDVSDIEALYSQTKQKIQDEQDFYNQIIEKEYVFENCKNPYIPEGFEYVEGKWNTGFVVQDEKENQYVWIPCTNIKNNENIEILKKSNFSNIAFIKSFDCYEENYEDFLISVLTNGGYYISRFEIGKDEDGNPVSKLGYELFNNVTKGEAVKLSKDMQKNINSRLINGYAYDTAFSWILKEENVEVMNINSSNLITGTKSYKNIYDMLDNIYEFTSEECYGEYIYRGIIPDTKYMENNGFDNRLSCDDNYINENIGFRTMLYK